MRATSIPAHEASFLKSGRDAHGKQFVLTGVSEPVPGEAALDIVDAVREDRDTSYYFLEPSEKLRIVVHFTAGYLKGDVAALTHPGSHVSVALLVARNGAILRLWDPRYWSYHLGPGAAGGNSLMSKTSIGIELSNIGPLVPRGARLSTTYGEADTYCDASQASHYVQLPAAYRTHTCFATFTDAQYRSLARLLRLLTAAFAIPRRFLEPGERFETFDSAAAVAYRGIASHVNFRAQGKWDVGPAFDWDRLIAAVTA